VTVGLSCPIAGCRGLHATSWTRTIRSSRYPPRPPDPSSRGVRLGAAGARTPRKCIALVAMTDRARRRSPSPTRHLQGIDDQVGARVVGDRPAHNHPRIHIQHRAAVHRACAGAVFGDVGDPQRVRTVGDEPTLHQVIRSSWIAGLDF